MDILDIFNGSIFFDFNNHFYYIDNQKVKNFRIYYFINWDGVDDTIHFARFPESRILFTGCAC